MARQSRILLIGTADTKAQELQFLAEHIAAAGGEALVMDVGVLGEPPFNPAVSKHDVAAAAGTTNQAVIELGNEHEAMVEQARGATQIAKRMAGDNEIDGMLAIGGSMATDLALDVANVLPLGFPKFIVSTVAFSAVLPAERLPADVMMILWSGGLYGLNPVCAAVLTQAAGAVVGATRSSSGGRREKPLIGMTSLGSSTLKYMVALKPEIEQRGFELAVFHTTGMGGRAFESLCAQNAFAAVMDFSLIEVCDDVHGSPLSSGESRLEAAGNAGIPQIVAPGGVTLVDLCAWAAIPERFAGREIYTHNRLISCAKISAAERVQVADVIAAKLNAAKGPVAFILPNQGIDEWDKAGGPFHDPEAMDALSARLRDALDSQRIELHEIDAHINDPLFTQTALNILDEWIASGVVSVSQQQESN